MSAKKGSLFVIENNIIKSKKLPPPPTDKCMNQLILDNLKKNPDFIGQIDPQKGETCTYKKLADDSIRCALWLKKQGIGTNDIVSICSHNNIESWAPFCAILFVGANLNPWYNEWSPDTAKYFVNLTKPKVIFANEQAGKMLKEVIKNEKKNIKIVVFGNVSELDSFDDILKQASSEEVENFQCHPVKPDDSALMLFSSGSTGLPKGVQHSYLGVYYNLYRFQNKFIEDDYKVSMFTSSLYWISGSLCTLRSLLFILPAVIMNNPTPEEVCKTIEKYKVQWIFVGTGLINELFKLDAMNQYDLSSVKVFLTGGSKVRPEITKKVNSMLQNGEILQGYGLTELGGIAVLQEKGHSNHESLGMLTYDLEMKIIDINTKQILGPNQQGEMLFRQKYMMKYYFLNPKATQDAVDKEGWLHTGDIGYYDEEANIYYVDRMKEVIKYRGHHVSPIEIESILSKHPKVLDAAVVPVPHSVDDEHPLAFVTKLPNSEVSTDELLKMTSILGDTKKLRGGIVFLDTLPKTPSGKINRSKLKEMAKVYAQ